MCGKNLGGKELCQIAMSLPMLTWMKGIRCDHVIHALHTLSYIIGHVNR